MPLTVIGGFLGAGKTTLLNRWLRDAGGRRLAVLVNDFGALNIDVDLIAASAGDTIALTNGCVCCSIGDDLTTALIGVLESTPPFDAVIIEASGVSDPWRIAQVGLADPGLTLDGVIVVLDASAALEQALDPLLADSLERQLRSADLIVVNKTDLIYVAELARVREWVASVAGAAPVFETANAEVPLPVLTGAALLPPQDRHRDGLAACDVAPHEHGGDAQDEQPHDHGALFDTWSCRPAQSLSAAALRAWLRDMPAGVLRLKGWVHTDEFEWAEIQFAGRRGSLRKAFERPASGVGVVAIGLRGRLPAALLEGVFDPARPAVSGQAASEYMSPRG
ncbi:MAG: GTP-binding protein [Methylibium sp.]|nr:GTP-binding protein [Methylibium sp.]